jgi:hypothetical protein
MIGVDKLMGKIIHSIEYPSVYSDSQVEDLKKRAFERLPSAYILLLDTVRICKVFIDGNSTSEKDKEMSEKHIRNIKLRFPYKTH